MPNAYVIDAKEEHIEHIAQHMRSADVLEVEASGVWSPEQALYNGLISSSKVWTALIGDEPILMFGVVPVSVLGGVGSPWLLGTDRVLDIKRQFIKECRHYVDEMLKLYPKLTNYTDCRNTVSHRWLAWLGFELEDAFPIGMNNEPFYRFSKKA